MAEVQSRGLRASDYRVSSQKLNQALSDCSRQVSLDAYLLGVGYILHHSNMWDTKAHIYRL